MALPTVTGEFRVAADPELRFTPSGHAVANLRLVANSRKLNKTTDQWEDDKVVWLNATAWNALAENIAESITQGMLVIVKGRLQTRSYETREGEKRSSTEMELDEIGPSLKYASAKVTAVTRTQGQSGSSGGAPAADPTPSTEQAADPWGPPAGGSDEPPF